MEIDVDNDIRYVAYRLVRVSEEDTDTTHCCKSVHLNMRDTVGIKYKLLLITDDDQAQSDLSKLFQQKSTPHYQISSSGLSGLDDISQLSMDQDIGLIWLSDQKHLDRIANARLEGCTLPLLLITSFDLSADQSESMEQLFEECFVSSELSATLLIRTLSSVFFERQDQTIDIDKDENIKAILDVVSEGIVICDSGGRVAHLNPVAEKIFGVDESEAIDRPLTQFFLDKYTKSIQDFFDGNSDENRFVLIKEIESHSSEGDVFPVEIVVSRTRVNEELVFTCTVRDVTLKKLRDQEFNLAATIFESHTAMLITDKAGIILRVNPAFTRITGYSHKEVVGQNPRILQSGHQSKEFYQNFWQSINETGKWEGEIWNKRKNGEIYPEYQTITAVVNRKGETTHYVATFQDITERKQTEALIEHQAFYDALTNLPNRRLILDRLNQELSAARRHNFYGALLFMDLDHFKTLNDSMGHAVGDMLLQQMADRLSDQVRKEDTVARLGGDEFVVLLANLGTDEYKAGKLASTIAGKIHASLVEPYALQGNKLKFTSSIGISLFPFDDESADDVLKHADSAMYRAKHMGRDAICFYKPSMQEEADRRLKVEKDLRVALEKKEMSLYYQPQFSHDGSVVGVEALLRWVHPEEGTILPSEFIPLAEEINLIQPIGEWVLSTAIQQYMRWKGSGVFRGNEYVAVNVSPKQIQHGNFVMNIQQLLIAHDMPAKCLKLELTESVLMNELREVTSKMQQLKEIGVTFSMDDFGTGFSSLSYLKRLPFDQIKIDKTFVRDVSQSMNDAAIVETIIAMAEHLNLDVIAEGVESREEMDFLHEKGCTTYQGFYFSTPLPVFDFEKFLREWTTNNNLKKLGS